MKKKYIQPTIKDHVLQTKNSLLGVSDPAVESGSGQNDTSNTNPSSSMKLGGDSDGSTLSAKGNYFSDWDE